MSSSGPDLAQELDVLYGLPPDEFVAARDDLVRRLRSAGRKDDAASVKRLRRPTVAAWALNQLSRRHRDDVERLIRHGEQLRRVQQELLAGRGRDQLRAATSNRRTTLDQLVDATLALLSQEGRGGADAHRDEVLSTLEAASLEPEAGAALRKGRLATGLRPTAGFDLLADTAPDSSASSEGQDVPGATEAGTRPPKGGTDTEAVAHEARLSEARQVAADARDLARRRRTEAGEMAEKAARARRLAREADQEVERLARDLENARRAAARAASTANDAETQLAEVERMAARAESQAAAAEAALARLERG